MRLAARALVATALFALAACKPKEGGSCTFTKATCTSSDEGLFCEHPGTGPGKLRRYHCGGPKGCYRDGTMIRCDQSVGAIGDRCTPGSSGGSCDVAGDALLECTGGTLTKEFACRGPGGCTSVAGRVKCDTSVAEVGDPCSAANEGKSACTPDHKERLDCASGKHVVAARCEGPAGCTNDKGEVRCDGARMVAGAACTGEGLAECGADGKVVLHCRSSRMIADGHACLGENGCYSLGGRIACDQSVAEAGAACANEGQVSCSKDGTATVVCTSGTFTAGRACPKGCTVGADVKGYVAHVVCR